MDQFAALAAPLAPVTLWPAVPARSPLILASPHAGREYRADFLAASRLEKAQLRKTEDAFVDLLFQDAPLMGVPLLCANFPRAWVDVNREEWELDPGMFADKLPDQVAAISARVAAGLGAIPRVGAAGAPIYRRKLRAEEALLRLELGWRPYHNALAALIGETKRQFGWCLLVDCHSMPSAQQQISGERTAMPDFILGDVFGTSCRPDLVTWWENQLQGRGYSVRRNTPYAGGYVTRHYGQPARGVHVLQLEAARRLYMDENATQPHQGFGALRSMFNEILGGLVERLGNSGI